MMFEDDDRRSYLVVRNDEDQYSIWPRTHPLPAGWQATGEAGTKTECLDHIALVWTDLRPKSLRDRDGRS